MPEIIGRLWTSRKHHEWSCLSSLNCTGQFTPPKDCITWRTYCSASKSCPTLCDLMDSSMPGFPVLHYVLEFAHMFIELVMPSNHLILCLPFLLLPSIFPSIKVFSSELALLLRWPKYWSFSISSSNDYSGLISFRIDWFDLLAAQGTLKNLLQHHSLKASVLWCSAFFMVQFIHD